MPALPEKSSLHRGTLSWGGVVRSTMDVLYEISIPQGINLSVGESVERQYPIEENTTRDRGRCGASRERRIAVHDRRRPPHRWRIQRFVTLVRCVGGRVLGACAHGGSGEVFRTRGGAGGRRCPGAFADRSRNDGAALRTMQGASSRSLPYRSRTSPSLVPACLFRAGLRRHLSLLVSAASSTPAPRSTGGSMAAAAVVRRSGRRPSRRS